MDTSNSIKRVLAIINPAAGQKQPVLHTLNQVFTAAGIEWNIAVTKGKGDAFREAAQAAEANFDVIAVYGGDGTIMEVANALNGTQMPVAILPGGTANILSVELGIPSNLEKAARRITESSRQFRPVDMGSMNDQLFFHLSVGILGNLINNTDRNAKNQSGLLAYLAAGIQELQQMPSPFQFKLTLDGEQTEVEGIGCMVTNLGKVGIGDLRLSDDIDLSDGIMDVMVIRDITLPTLMKALAGAVASGELSDALWHRRVKEVTLSVGPEMKMMLDGESFESSATTLAAHVVPGAVNFLV